MAALFALGVMSVPWMIVVAAMIALEKLLPWKALANSSIAAVLLALGIAVAFAPGDVPGLTIPGSPAAMRAMQGMGTPMKAMPAAHAPVKAAPGMPAMPAKPMKSAPAMPAMPAKPMKSAPAMPGTSTPMK
jgi:hypothetical protein